LLQTDTHIQIITSFSSLPFHNMEELNIKWYTALYLRLYPHNPFNSSNSPSPHATTKHHAESSVLR